MVSSVSVLVIDIVLNRENLDFTGVERSPSEPRASSNAGVSSTASQFAMKTMVKTIASLNEELAKVRDENSESTS